MMLVFSKTFTESGPLLPKPTKLGLEYYKSGADPFPIAQETLPWQPILEAKSVKLAYSPSFIALAFWKQLEYRNADGHANNSNDRSASCRNLVSFGPRTLEFAKVDCEIFVMNSQNAEQTQ